MGLTPKIYFGIGRMSLDHSPKARRFHCDTDNQTSLTSGTKLTETEYYLFFSALMFITAVLFIPYAMVFKERTYIQDSQAELGEQ